MLRRMGHIFTVPPKTAYGGCGRLYTFSPVPPLDSLGHVNEFGDSAGSGENAIRPALRIDLNA